MPPAKTGLKSDALFMRDLDGIEIGQSGDPDGAGEAAMIVAPRHVGGVVESECRTERRIGNLFAVGRELSLVRHGQRQRRGDAALGGDRIELRIAARRFPIGTEQNVLAIVASIPRRSRPQDDTSRAKGTPPVTGTVNTSVLPS